MERLQSDFAPSMVTSQLKLHGISDAQVLHVRETNSTMDIMKLLREREPAHTPSTNDLWKVLVAYQQTRGVTEKPTLRWFGYPGDIMMTIVVPEAQNFGEAMLHHLAGTAGTIAGLRVCCEELNVSASKPADRIVLKFPNDPVVVSSDGFAKLAGVMLADPWRTSVYEDLIERYGFLLPAKGSGIALLGIGINNTAEIEREYRRLKEMSGESSQEHQAFSQVPISLESLLGRPLQREKIVAAVVAEVYSLFSILQNRGREAFIDQVQHYLPQNERSFRTSVREEIGGETRLTGVGTIVRLTAEGVFINLGPEGERRILWDHLAEYRTVYPS